MLKTILKAGLAAGALVLTTASLHADGHQCTNEVWKKVMSAGKIVIGVKADYKPWGFRDPSGKLVGMEADMAQDVADAMGVELELVEQEMQGLLQEIRVQHAELKAQNLELKRIGDDLDASHRKYKNLFDLAPIGYLSLDIHCRIIG